MAAFSTLPNWRCLVAPRFVGFLNRGAAAAAVPPPVAAPKALPPDTPARKRARQLVFSLQQLIGAMYSTRQQDRAEFKQVYALFERLQDATRAG